MLQLTETVGERLRNSLAGTQMDKDDYKCFRVIPKDDRRLTLKVAKPAPSDVMIEHDGDVVLAVPRALRPFFKDKCLDMDKTGNLRLC